MIGGGTLRSASVVAIPPAVTTASPPRAVTDVDVAATAATAPPARATGAAAPAVTAAVTTARPRKAGQHGCRIRGGVGALGALVA
jgi:hypothetical protein